MCDEKAKARSKCDGRSGPERRPHMSAEAIEGVLQRAREDPVYAERLRHEPDAALHGYDIGYDERQALISGDAEKLVELGVNRELALQADFFNPVRQEPST
jgi:hypothetical protein